MESWKGARARVWAAVTVPAAVLLAAACGGDGGSATPGTAAGGPAASPGTRLVITTANGVRLRPAGAGRAAVQRGVTHRWYHRDGTWVLDLSCPAHGDGPCPRMPRVGIPADTSVTVSARDAGIDVAGVSAALDLTTVNGDVTVAGSGRRGAAVRLVTRNGSVRATQVRSGSLHAGTVNGDVALGCAAAPSRVTASTANGSVHVTVPHAAPAYRVTATTANGRAAVTVPTEGAPPGRTMTLTTVNGDVTADRG
nr:DUF4097 family beta strand repeat-containing protein [Streptomyces triticisoli]